MNLTHFGNSTSEDLNPFRCRLDRVVWPNQILRFFAKWQTVQAIKMNMPHLTARACKTEWICSFFAPRALRIRGWLKSKTVQRGYTVAWAFCWLPVLESTESLQCVPCEICSFNVHSSWKPPPVWQIWCNIKISWIINIYHAWTTYKQSISALADWKPLEISQPTTEKSWFGRPGTCFQIRWLLAFKGIPFPWEISPPPTRPVNQSTKVTCTVQSGGRLHPALQRPAPGRPSTTSVSPWGFNG